MNLCRETIWDTQNDGTQYAKLEEADLVYDFFARLNPKFDTVCGRILGQRPLPSLMEVCFEVRLEEDRTNAMGVLTTPTIDYLPLTLGPQIMTVTRIMESQFLETTPASTSQSTDPTASQIKTPTLGAIAQSGMSQSLGLISVDGKNPWILDSGATVAERKNRHIVEVACSLMLSTSLPSYLWGDAFLTATHLINRMPSRILHLQTPLDCLKESYSSTHLVSEVPLSVFGCTAYVHNFGPNQTKFTPRAQACVFVGYPLHQRGYKCFHPPSRKYFVTMDVTFCENRPYLPVSHLQGRVRNLRKEVGSPTGQQPAPVQDFEPPRDQGMENPTEPCTNNTISENDRSDVAVLENMEEKNRGDETEVSDPALNIPLATMFPMIISLHKMKALKKNRTWEICALPKGHKTVGCKWAFSLKYKVDGTLDRHKARVLLSVAVNKDWSLYQLDVKNAFLNGDLVEEVYLSPPPGFEAQFGQQSQGYSQGHSDHTLFTKVSKTGKIAILIVYVDDIVLTGDDQTEISQLKQRMGDEFEIKDLGNLKYFLGIEVARSKEGISMSQRKYTLDLLTETVPVDKEQYQRLAFYEKHMEAINRILRYLKNTPELNMLRLTDISSKKDLTMEAYAFRTFLQANSSFLREFGVSFVALWSVKANIEEFLLHLSFRDVGGFFMACQVVREERGPYSDPQHPYFYEEEDTWMAPGFINQFYEVPDYWKTYVHEVDQEREMWLNSFYKAPLRLPMPAELEYWWEQDHIPEFVLVNKEPEPDPEDPSKHVYTEDPLILHTPTGRLINYIEDEEYGVRMFWQPPLKEGEDVDPEKVDFLPLGFDEFYGRAVTEKKENFLMRFVSGLENGLKSRLENFEKWAEEKKKDSEMKKELIEKELELIEAEICLEETIEDMEEELKRKEEEEEKKVEMGLLDEDSTSSTNLDKKASVEEEDEEEDDYDDEDTFDAPPSSFGSIAADQDPSKDQKPNKPTNSPFSTASLHFASRTPVSGVPSRLIQSIFPWTKGRSSLKASPSSCASRDYYSESLRSVCFPRMPSSKGSLKAVVPFQWQNKSSILHPSRKKLQLRPRAESHSYHLVSINSDKFTPCDDQFNETGGIRHSILSWHTPLDVLESYADTTKR
ncbi:protein TIC 100 [Cucumis melo var. makuwa]|uniref:Protein TIC 100 n=1 Tax=Cucumis melo var. makuwa TaxID=1194695 RepID=A0A5A7SW35_CUCMM|nr:protein TIC 100 [Cucumis melo var. makuwa]